MLLHIQVEHSYCTVYRIHPVDNSGGFKGSKSQWEPEESQYYHPACCGYRTKKRVIRHVKDESSVSNAHAAMHALIKK